MADKMTGYPELQLLVGGEVIGAAARETIDVLDPATGELLKQGRLVQILSDWTISRPGIFLYYSNWQHRPALLGSFIDCMLDREPFGDA